MKHHEMEYTAAQNMLCKAAEVEFQTAIEKSQFSIILRPRLFIDGNMWCALYGKNLQDGVAGFGETPALAMQDFDKSFITPLYPVSIHELPPALGG